MQKFAIASFCKTPVSHSGELLNQYKIDLQILYKLKPLLFKDKIE